MACRLTDFDIKEWKTLDVDGHKVEVAEAKTRGMGLDGVVYKLDGKFKGFTGNEEAAIYWVKEALKVNHA